MALQIFILKKITLEVDSMLCKLPSLRPRKLVNVVPYECELRWNYIGVKKTISAAFPRSDRLIRPLPHFSCMRLSFSCFEIIHQEVVLPSDKSPADFTRQLPSLKPRLALLPLHPRKTQAHPLGAQPRPGLIQDFTRAQSTYVYVCLQHWYLCHKGLY